MFILAELKIKGDGDLSSGGLDEARFGLGDFRNNLLNVRVSCWGVIGRIGCYRFFILRTCGRVCSLASSLLLFQRIL